MIIPNDLVGTKASKHVNPRSEMHDAQQLIYQPHGAEVDAHAVFGASRSKFRRQPIPLGTPRATGQFMSPFIRYKGCSRSLIGEEAL